MLFIALLAAVHADEDAPKVTPDDFGYETDRPGELENPFALPAGQAELVTYVVGMNSDARSDQFGGSGSATLLDTAVRIGLPNRFEGVVTLDTLLASHSPAGGGGTAAGVGYGTVFAKWSFLSSLTGDYGLAIAPFVRLPINQQVTGSARPTTGLIVPFDLDLEGGWEIEGSSGITRQPGRSSTTSSQWENQGSLQRTVTKRLNAYVELQLQTGDSDEQWAIEYGLTYRITKAAVLDVGSTDGVGHGSNGRMAYIGLGWAL